MKLNSIILPLIFIVSNTLSAMETTNNNNNNDSILKLTGKFYSTILGGSLVHELGHLIAGKILLKCNGIIFVTPFNLGGTVFYQGQLFKKIAYAIFKKKHDHLKINIIDTSNLKGFKGAVVLASGPLFGISYAFLLPIINTFYHEYKEEKYIILAFEKTSKQNYYNDKQNIGILLGALFSGITDILNFLPTAKNDDGTKILECFNVSRKRILFYNKLTTILILPVSALCSSYISHKYRSEK